MAAEIPLTDYPDTEMAASLDGTIYIIRVRWNSRGEGWFVDISTEDGEYLARGVRVCTSWPVGGMRGCGPAGALMLTDCELEEAEPEESGLGTRWRLYYWSADDVADLE